MPKENYTHVAIVLDRSGSMNNIASDMVGGLKTLIEEQKQLDGEATLTYATFDDEYELVHDFINLNDVNEISLNPRGLTALLDAMGRTISNVKEKISKMKKDEKPSKVLFVFITDGMENASGEYTRDAVFKLINELKSDGKPREDQDEPLWDFVFMGANQDAISEGGSMGFSKGSSFTYAATSDGVKNSFSSLSRNMSNYRSAMSSNASFSFKEEDRKAQEDLDKTEKTNK